MGNGAAALGHRCLALCHDEGARDRVQPAGGERSYVDISAASSDLVIARAAIPYFTRILPVGGNRLTKLVAKYAGLEGNEAKQLKRPLATPLAEPGEFSQENREYQVNMGLKAGLKTLPWSCAAPLIITRYSIKEKNISRLILSGGSAPD